jgi:perosamine synthetase
MTNICAAIGVAQLSIADEILKRKRDIAGWYRKYLAHVPVQFQTEPSDAVHSWWMFSILVETEASRDLLRNGLRIAGIETRPLFHPIHLQPPYQTGASFPIAEDLAKRGLNLPSYPDLREEDVAKISEAISHILT